jgi:hypothetical protein
MVKTKKRIYKNSNKSKSKSKKYKSLNLSVSEFRNQDKDYEELENKFINFLKNNPSKEKINKLYDTTIYFAESDSIGEGWNYVDDFTRQEFNIACKLIKYDISSLTYKELKRQTDMIKQKIETDNKINKNDKDYEKIMNKNIKKLEKEDKYPNYRNIENKFIIDNNILSKKEYDNYKENKRWYNDEYIHISYDLLNHLRVL